MTKTEFINTLRIERAKLDSTLAALTSRQLIRRASPKAWSIKDHLAHLTYWEQYMLQRVRQASLGESPKWVSIQEETEINARVFERNRSRSLARVLADMHRSLADTFELIELLSEADLTDPRRFAWLKGKPLYTYIANEGYDEHYHDHLKALGLD